MKKKIIIIISIIMVLLLIGYLYQTYAISSNISGNNDNYIVSLGNDTSVTIDAGTNKTIYYKIRNTNNGILIYGIGYKNNNVNVKVYSDSENDSIGYIDKEESKFIKLYIENNTTNSETINLTAVFGYVNGGELIFPNGYKLITSKLNKYKGAAYKIVSLFDNSTKNEFTSVNGINYIYSEDNNLIEDAYGNIRYYGSSPNNYIYFNCSDYSNQNSDTCEVWRIIGVVDGKVKIMRNSIIGEYSWDNKNKSTGSKDDSGSNDWSKARLMKLLNSSDYYSTDSNDNGYGQSLYWNSESGTCFSGKNNATTSCDFTSTGIKNDVTKNMISEFNYYLKSPKKEYSTSSFYANEIYYNERYGGIVYDEDNANNWIGKIALPYASDYAYAVDLSTCNYKVNEYNNCASTNWMFPICSSYYTWLLTPSEGTNSTSFTVFRWRPPIQGQVSVNSPGLITDAFVTYYPWGVIPTLYLNNNLDISIGDGSSTNPYQLKIKEVTEYTVSYDANGGNGAPSDQIKYENENLTLSSVKPTKSGYTFTGWNTKSDGTGTSYSSGSIYSDNSSITLYAMWTSVSSYNVTVYLQGELINTYTVVPGNDLNTRFGVNSEELIRYNNCTNGASISATVGRVNNMSVVNITVTNITSDTVCNLYYSLI